MYVDQTLFTAFSWTICVGGLPSTVGVINKFFDSWDPLLSPAARKSLADWLRGLKPELGAQHWPNAFSSLVDRLFGIQPFSLRFFLRSCIASAFALGVVVIVEAGEYPDRLLSIDQIPLMIPIGLLAGSLPNYFSLIISRTVLRFMARNNETVKVFLLLLLDAALKLVFVTASVYLCAVIFHYIRNANFSYYCESPWVASRRSVLTLYSIFYSQLVSKPDDEPILLYKIVFCSSFFTSIWVWFYVTGALFLKMLAKTGRLWLFLARVLDLDNHPLQSVGRVIATLVGILYATGICIFLVARAFSVSAFSAH